MATKVNKKVLLISQIKDKSRLGKTFELTAGMGDAGQTIRIAAESQTI